MRITTTTTRRLALFTFFILHSTFFISASAAGAGALIADRTALFLPDGLTLEKTPASLALVQRPKITAPLPADWPAALTPKFSTAGKRARFTLPIASGDSLYGTGEAVGPLLRNGQSNILWNSGAAGFTTRKNPGLNLYQSHPWILALRADGTAYGIIADTTWRSEIHLGSPTDPNPKIEFTSDGPAFPVIIIDRDTPQAVLAALATLTGHMELPPLWSLGFQQSRHTYTPDSRAREIATEFRTRKIPCDVLWFDILYMDGYRNFTFDPKTYPDPKTLNAWLHDRGFKTIWMLDIGVKANDPRYNAWLTGNKHDVWIQTSSGDTKPFRGNVWPGPCNFPDFTRPETRAWWAAQFPAFMATGIDGIWNDMNEPAVFNTPDHTIPADAWHRGGGNLEPNTHARYHNAYGMLETRATRDGILLANPAKRPFVLTRASYLGGQRYAAMWTGDNTSTWEHLRLSIPMALNIGLSGQPFNGPDIGGFNGPATPDLWAHWIAMGVFFPFARAHASIHAPNKEPWAFGPEVETTARTAIERRYRLLPYYYTLFHESSQDGMPVMRPTFFADLHDPALRAEQQTFLVGADLLVIPKWAEAPTLPKGIWRPITLVGETPDDKYQPTLKIRGGAIIPLGKVIQNTTEKSLDPLTLLVCLDAQGTATGQLYEDAGEGFDYRKGDYLLTTYRAALDPATNTVTITIAAAEGSRPRPARPIAVQLVTESGVQTATGQDGQPIRVPLSK